MPILTAPLPRYRIYTTASDYREVVRSVVRSALLKGDDCGRLEDEVCRRQSVGHAVCVPMARVGIYLAVKALVRPGHKVVLSPYTLADVVNMVVCAGAIPVFADVDRDTCNISPDQIEALADDKTDAVLVTHLHGLACNMASIVEICRRRKLKLIEDCAQALGAHLDGRPVGTFGDAGIFSFGLYKNVNAFFGGMLVTNDRKVSDAIRSMTADWPAQDPNVLIKRTGYAALTDIATLPAVFKTFTYWVFRFGFLRGISAINRQVLVDSDPQLKTSLPGAYARKMTPMQARLVRRQLPDVERLVKMRIDAAQLYNDGLKGLPGVIQPPFRKDTSHTYLYYPIQVPDRSALLHHMFARGRDVAIQHLRNCADVRCFSDYARDCPNARAAAESNILLPTYPRYSVTEVRRNIEAIRSFFGAA